MHLLLLLGRVTLFGLNCKENRVTVDTENHCASSDFNIARNISLQPQSLSTVCEHFGLTVLSAGDLGQNPERLGLSGAGSWAPVLRVLGDALPAGVRVSGHVVEVDVSVHDVFPGDSVEDNKDLNKAS